MTIDPRKLTVLAVDLNGRRIGVINRLPGDKQLFAFEQEYIDDPGRPTLSLSYKSRTGGLVTAAQQVHRRVPPFFSNLLPEGHLRTYLAEHAGVDPEREFFLLAALGADLAGAVTVTPLPHGGDDHHDAADAHDDGEANNDARSRRGALRFSLAGVQLKFSAVMEPSGGLTIPAQGIGGSWIVKLPSMRFAAVSENEFLMLELARAIGIQVERAAKYDPRGQASCSHRAEVCFFRSGMRMCIWCATSWMKSSVVKIFVPRSVSLKRSDQLRSYSPGRWITSSGTAKTRASSNFDNYFAAKRSAGPVAPIIRDWKNRLESEER